MAFGPRTVRAVTHLDVSRDDCAAAAERARRRRRRGMSEPIWFDDAGRLARLAGGAPRDGADEVWVGMYKKHSPRHNMTWSEAVDEALCFGWIDSVMHRIDDERHAQRFTPAQAGQQLERGQRRQGRAAPRRRAGCTPPARPRSPAAATTAPASTPSSRRDAAELSAEQRAALDADAGGGRVLRRAAARLPQLAVHWVTGAKKARDARAPARAR